MTENTIKEEQKILSDGKQSMKEYFKELKARPVLMNVKGLSKVFPTPKGPVTALKNINMGIREREFLSVIGPSGCGKSTLVRMLAGLEEISEGSIYLADKAIRGPGPERGMVFQSYTLFPWKTVIANVMFGLQQQGMSKAKAKIEAFKWLRLVGLHYIPYHYPSQLSGGQKQRVAIARALANRPRVLLMDEPFGALDAQTRAKLQYYLLQIWKKVNITIVFITHDLDEAVYLSDQVLVLKSRPGEVMEVLDVKVDRPRHPRQFVQEQFIKTKAYLQSLIYKGEDKDDRDELSDIDLSALDK